MLSSLRCTKLKSPKSKATYDVTESELTTSVIADTKHCFVSSEDDETISYVFRVQVIRGAISEQHRRSACMS